MDNLTHSLVGALIGQTGLKRRSGLAMPALILGANSPDIDVFAGLAGIESIAFHRGFSHGIGGMVLLPPLIVALLVGIDRWQRASGRRPERRAAVRPLPLLALTALATLTHPALDWLNTYGVRLLEPFSDRWFYGDVLFIIDVWLWAALIGALLLSRRRETAGRSDWSRPAIATFAAIACYITLNGAITARAEASAEKLLANRRGPAKRMIVAQPPPVAFWQRTILWREARVHGSGDYSLGRGVAISPAVRPNRLDEPLLAQMLQHDAHARAYYFWARMPIVTGRGRQALLLDQRFAGRIRPSSFAIPLDPRAAR